MGYCLYRPQPFEAGPGAESVRSVADSCWSRIKGRDKVELKLGCGNYDPQTPPSTLDSISLKDYPDRLLDAVRRSGKASSSWEARLELQNGSSIKLGREPTGRNEHIRGLLDEIRRATDIGGA